MRGCDLDARLRGRERRVPLLVVRVVAVERIAWEHGRTRARRFASTAERTFAIVASHVLRAGDLTAHDPHDATFLVALCGRSRRASGGPSPLEVRATLARLERGLEDLLGGAIAVGWTLHRGRDEADDTAALVARALRAGAEERVRYAFFSRVGHELRTPLAAVRGYLETALDERDDVQRRTFAAIAHRETLRLCRLVEAMFEMSLLDLHPPDRGRATASLAAVVAGGVRACAAHARARNVDVRVSREGDAVVEGTTDHLVLAVANVVGNAVQHGRAGGVVAVTARARRTVATITVDDDGPGVPVTDRARIFVLGERGAGGGSGTGIGLATARMLLERAGGHITAGASPLGGARFVMSLPRVSHRPR